MSSASSLIIRLSMTGGAYVRSMLQSITTALGSVTAKIAASAKYAAIGGIITLAAAAGAAGHQVVKLGINMEQTGISVIVSFKIILIFSKLIMCRYWRRS